MAKINITLNNKNYSIEESSLSEAINALQTHLSTTMSGTGATINFGDTSYSVDSTKLSAATAQFVSHLGKISGNGSKVIVGGVEYSIGSDKVSGAIGELETVFDELSKPTLNEYGFYYNRLYTGCVDGANIAFLYREDGTLYLISVDYTRVVDTGSYTVNGNTIINNASSGTIPTTISSNGSELQCAALGASFILDELNTTDEDYIYMYNSSLGGYGVTPIDRTKAEYGAIKPSINGINTVCITPNAFAYCDNLTTVTIPDGVTTIGDSAFEACTSLTSVTIPDGVTTIGNSAFFYCTSLTTMTIGDGVTTIGTGAFEACTSLTNITIPNSVTNIGGSAFYECDSLTTLTIPDSVTTLEGGVIYGCDNLTTLTIGAGVTTIVENAISYCDKLVSITFNGSVEQWNAITFGSGWNTSIPATHIQCSDGQVKI